MEHLEHNLEDRTLEDRAVERFNERGQEQVTLAEWLASGERAHDGIADRRIVEVSGAMACEELQAEKYTRALHLMNRIHRGASMANGDDDKLTISEWRDGKIGKHTIDNYFRNVIENENRNDIQTGAEYTEVCCVMDKLIRGDDYEVVITNEPSAFLRMGCQSIDNNSCYRAGHECEAAPLIIAEQRGSFIAYIKHHTEEKVIARCWGIENTDGEWFFTNVYARGLMPYTARSIFIAALRVVCYSPLSLIRKCEVNRPNDVYLNGDLVANTDRLWHIESDITSRERGFCNWCEENCIECEDDERYSDHGTICASCCDNSFVWSEYSDNYIHGENATCLQNGEYCPSDNAIELYDGGFASDDCGVTLIQIGSHADSYALDDDEALLFTPCCNEAYIEGSLE